MPEPVSARSRERERFEGSPAFHQAPRRRGEVGGRKGGGKGPERRAPALDSRRRALTIYISLFSLWFLCGLYTVCMCVCVQLRSFFLLRELGLREGIPRRLAFVLECCCDFIDILAFKRVYSCLLFKVRV